MRGIFLVIVHMVPYLEVPYMVWGPGIVKPLLLESFDHVGLGDIFCYAIELTYL